MLSAASSPYLFVQFLLEFGLVIFIEQHCLWFGRVRTVYAPQCQRAYKYDKSRHWEGGGQV